MLKYIQAMLVVLFICFLQWTCLNSQETSTRVTLCHNYHHGQESQGRYFSVQHSDMQGRHQTSHISQCDGIVRDGSNWSSSCCSWPDKINASTIVAHPTAFYTCLSPLLDGSRLRWHVHLINQFFDHWKNLKKQEKMVFLIFLEWKMVSKCFMCQNDSWFL